MSIQDREWYAEETLKKMGIHSSTRSSVHPGFAAFLAGYHRHLFARRRRAASWFWLAAFVVVLAVLAVGLFKAVVFYFKTLT